MLISLNEPRVKDLLDRLYGEATQRDDAFLPPVRAAMKANGVGMDIDFAPMLREAAMPVAPEVGRLFYQLVRAKRPKLVVEFGTSFGLSALHIAAALRDNGEGRLIATELEAAKVARARAHFVEAGLENRIELREGDALDTLRDVSNIDLLLLDGWKSLYLAVLRQLEPGLSPGCLVLADDTTLVPEWMADYLAYIRDPANGYVSVELPIDDGIEMSMR